MSSPRPRRHRRARAAVALVALTVPAAASALAGSSVIQYLTFDSAGTASAARAALRAGARHGADPLLRPAALRLPIGAPALRLGDTVLLP